MIWALCHVELEQSFAIDVVRNQPQPQYIGARLMVVQTEMSRTDWWLNLLNHTAIVRPAFNTFLRKHAVAWCYR